MNHQESPDRRVLRIITRLNIGGPSWQVLTLQRELPARGYSSRLLAGSVDAREGEVTPPPELGVQKVGALRRGLNPAADLRAAYGIRKAIASYRPVIVHTHHAKAGALGRYVAKTAGVPITVHTFHGHVLREYFAGPVEELFLRIERKLAGTSTALVAVSESVRDELLSLGVGRESQWRVIPLGLELKPLMERTLTQPEARKQLGLPSDGPLVGIVGRLAPIKDHETFLRACAKVAETHPHARFLVAGDGELRDRLVERAATLLGDRVVFGGWIMDLAALYAALDLVVLTSRNEGTPVALIEAAACRKPVVATDVGGVADVVLQEKTGFLANSGDYLEIAAKASFVLDNPEWARRAGEAARSHVAHRFSSDRLVADIVDLYGELLERHGARPASAT